MDKVIRKEALLVITKDVNNDYKKISNQEYMAMEEDETSRIKRDIRKHRKACKGIMELQKENQMYGEYI